MHIVALRRIVQTGSHRATAGVVVEVPAAIASGWIASQLARVATPAEIKSGAVETKKTDTK